MKKNIIAITLILFLGLCIFSYAEKGDGDVKKGPSLEDIERAKKISEQQQQKPILPPVMPAIPSGVSPTPPLYITAPQINQQAISPMASFVPNAPQYVIIQQPPVIPAQVIMPQVHIPQLPQQPPVIANPPVMRTVFGKVENKGINKNGSLWLVVNDEMFGETVNIDILNLNKGTPLLKAAKIINFEDIKINDTMDIVYQYQEDNEKNTAVFMRVITKEEIEMMKQVQEQQLTAASGKSEKKPEGSEKIDIENSSNQSKDSI